MNTTGPTLLLQSAPTPSGCGGCMNHDSGPRCKAQVTGEACAHPEFAGQMDQVALVLQALDRDVRDPHSGCGIVGLQWVRSLRIDGDEAELTLNFAPTCGAAQDMAEAAFQTLRRALPDTDVYVRHAA
jgi:metal-sulfur cluster biosynthetic enzyme